MYPKLALDQITLHHYLLNLTFFASVKCTTEFSLIVQVLLQGVVVLVVICTTSSTAVQSLGYGKYVQMLNRIQHVVQNNFSRIVIE
jgi:hypothetical protein